jgi:hypothetical protein
MTATVHVGVKASPVVDEKCIDSILPTNQSELLYSSRADFVDSRNHPSARSPVFFQPPFVACEKPPLQDQADKIYGEKRQRQINGYFH